MNLPTAPSLPTAKPSDVRGRRVLVRVDFNVPLVRDLGRSITKPAKIVDDQRIQASLHTITWLVEHQARVILMSHLGRPDGKVDLTLTLAPVANHLQQLLKQAVFFSPDCVGPIAQAAMEKLKPGQVLLLENLRFHGEE